MNRNRHFLLVILLPFLVLSGCAQKESQQPESAEGREGAALIRRNQAETMTEIEMEDQADMTVLKMNDRVFSVEWEDNDAVAALLELADGQPLTVSLQDYGEFEKVGRLPKSLPAEDIQLQTQSGDIMLYQGDKLVIFYGSNAWAYTRLGSIQDVQSLEQLLSESSDMDITIEQEE